MARSGSSSLPYCGVYDFELLPYALGDVLTWNIQTALRCEEAGRDRVDVYVCLDERYPSSVYQRGLVTAENCGLFFSELFGAFGTHPRLGNIRIFRDREEMRAELRRAVGDDPVNGEIFDDYERTLERRDDEDALNTYFIKYIYTHGEINRFAETHGHIPLLGPSLGCEPDVNGLIATLFAGRRVVVVHPRLRRLDQGYGGQHTNWRDSDFLEWFEFLRAAERRHPDVTFVVVGRLQEKPLEILKLPNVVTLRAFGLSLGHELTLMLRSHLFIGTSSGFAAMANFCRVPYFITRVNNESCNAYCIPQGTERLPFAAENQLLVYEPETTDLLLRLLDRGLAGTSPFPGAMPQRAHDLDPAAFAGEQGRYLYPGATTNRFFLDDSYSSQEAAALLAPRIEHAATGLAEDRAAAFATASRIEANFPRLRDSFPALMLLKEGVAARDKDKPAAIIHAPMSWKGRVVSFLPPRAQQWVLAARPVVRRLKRRMTRRVRIAAGD